MIAYGLGDFLNDYEGIVGQGYEDFRNDLSCLYLPMLKDNGDVVGIDIVPCKIKHLKVQRAMDSRDVEWICSVFRKEGEILGTSCAIWKDDSGNKNLRILWNK
eukprot:302272_1